MKMKKLVSISLVLVLAISLFSCTKKKIDKKKSLENTTWTSKGGNVIQEIKFTSKTDLTMTLSYTNNSRVFSGNGTYTYVDPNVTILIQGYIENGVIDGNELKLTPTSTGVTTVYIKN